MGSFSFGGIFVQVSFAACCNVSGESTVCRVFFKSARSLVLYSSLSSGLG